jgi:hypothetical protein
MPTVTSAQLKQLVWDYRITAEEFLHMLNDSNQPELTRDQRWAMVRILERIDYYSAMRLIGRDRLKQHWAELKSSIRPEHIKDAYDFMVSR